MVRALFYSFRLPILAFFLIALCRADSVNITIYVNGATGSAQGSSGGVSVLLPLSDVEGVNGTASGESQAGFGIRDDANASGVSMQAGTGISFGGFAFEEHDDTWYYFGEESTTLSVTFSLGGAFVTAGAGVAGAQELVQTVDGAQVAYSNPCAISVVLMSNGAIKGTCTATVGLGANNPGDFYSFSVYYYQQDQFSVSDDVDLGSFNISLDPTTTITAISLTGPGGTSLDVGTYLTSASGIPLTANGYGSEVPEPSTGSLVGAVFLIITSIFWFKRRSVKCV